MVKQSLSGVIKAAVLLSAGVLLLIAMGCGKRTPPLPPLERVPQRAVISAQQRGNQIVLTWAMPARNAGEGNVLNVDRVDIYRLAEPTSTSFALTEEEFSNRSTVISSRKVGETDFGLKKLAFTDILEFAGQSVRLIYAVRFVNASGQKAAFSNFIVVEPTARVADAPADLRSDITEEAVILRWSAPLANVDGSTPANVLGYNVYRLSGEEDVVKLLNETALPGTRFSDKTFEFGKQYIYLVRTASLSADGGVVESLDSSRVMTAPIDVFPPAAPGAITIAAAPNNLSIFFATNPEKDVAGYRIYRSEDLDRPLADWELLTAELLTTNTFQDKNIASGRIYYYYLTAADKAGNVSKPSEIVSETAP